MTYSSVYISAEFNEFDVKHRPSSVQTSVNSELQESRSLERCLQMNIDSSRLGDIYKNKILFMFRRNSSVKCAFHKDAKSHSTFLRSFISSPLETAQWLPRWKSSKMCGSQTNDIASRCLILNTQKKQVFEKTLFLIYWKLSYVLKSIFLYDCSSWYLWYTSVKFNTLDLALVCGQIVIAGKGICQIGSGLLSKPAIIGPWTSLWNTLE